LKRHELLVRKSSISLLDNYSINEQLLQNLKSKKFNDSLVLAFEKFSCYIQNLVIRQKNPYLRCCSRTIILFSTCKRTQSYNNRTWKASWRL